MKIAHPEKEKGKSIVVIVGAGFAGLNAAKALVDNDQVHVVIVDQRNHHLFQPLLYQVATAGLSPGDIAAPIRAQFSKNKNVEIHLGRIEKVNLAANTISTSSTDKSVEVFEMEYDFLILACGAQHSYFGHPEWEDHAPGLKTVEQAIEIRKRILLAFEAAENEFDPVRREALLNFVVVGGGATGVELSGAIADISRTVLINDFRNIDPSQAKIYLVEAMPKILSAFDDALSKKAAADLTRLGVDVRTSSKVVNITAEGVQLEHEFIPSRCVLWGAGVQAAPMKFDAEISKDRAGRIQVAADLTIPGHPNVFVVGDQASIQMDADKIVPGLAPAAIQAGKHVGRMIRQTLKGRARTPFKYFDKGQMATIGRHRAILQSGKIKMSGYLAWLAWFFVHIIYLVGFKNRVSVIAQWAWNYGFSKRGARLITENEWRLTK